MIYPIVAYGDPVLKKKAVDVDKSMDIETLIDDMFETMYNASGVGLAAPQIGKSVRLFIMDGGKPDIEDRTPFQRVFINPEIIFEEGEEWAFEEGCLSIPDVRQDVMRKPNIKIKYFDANWEEQEDEFDSVTARIIQHEYDHVEGILFTDYLSPMKKRLLKGRLSNISKGKIKVDYLMKFPNRKR